MLESIFNDVAGLKVCNFIKKIPTQVFPVYIVNFLGIAFLKTTSATSGGYFWKGVIGILRKAFIF